MKIDEICIKVICIHFYMPISRQLAFLQIVFLLSMGTIKKSDFSKMYDYLLDFRRREFYPPDWRNTDDKGPVLLNFTAGLFCMIIEVFKKSHSSKNKISLNRYNTAKKVPHIKKQENSNNFFKNIVSLRASY